METGPSRKIPQILVSPEDAKATGERTMYIAMNRFKIVPGREQDFEGIWRNRETSLDEVPGFVAFNLVRGAKEESHTLYASHSTWKSRDFFVNWTKSDAFRKAHQGAGEHSDVYIGHPVFEGFEVVL